MKAQDPIVTAFMEDSIKQRKELFTLVAVIQADLKINNAATQDISNAIGAFKILAVIFKWVAAIGAGAAAMWHGIDFIQHKH